MKLGYWLRAQIDLGRNTNSLLQSLETVRLAGSHSSPSVLAFLFKNANFHWWVGQPTFPRTPTNVILSLDF